MAYDIVRLNQSRIGIKKELAREIGVNEGDSIILSSEDIKGYGHILVMKKISDKDLKKLIGGES